ncbi:MAG TPA: EAL domain-containing protein [Burkholderiaceae bacterium]
MQTQLIKDESPVINSAMSLQPQRLKQVIYAALCANGALGILNCIAQHWLLAGQLLGTALILFISLLYARQGRTMRAAILMLTTMLISLSILIFNSHGLRDEAVSAFPGVMIFAGMFATRRLFLLMMGFIFAALTLIVWLNIAGLHSNEVPPVTYFSLFNVIGILSVTAFFVWLLASDWRRALARLEVENERMRESHERIDKLAFQDSLTGLPNRLVVRDRFEQAMALAKRNHTSVALLYLDLDDFKAINDSLGHSSGDVMLCDVAQRLIHAVRGSDTVSRQGGDEFLIVMGSLADDSDAAAMAVKIIDLLNTPFHVNGMEVSTTGSLGISLFPADGNDFETLLKNADMAMYRAKESGRNAFRFYDAQMNTNVIEHLYLISGIRAALAKNEFSLHYQPQFELTSGRIIGAEALIRWRHPELGLVPPLKFIPVAERCGLIHEVGRWVLNEACRQAKVWQEEGLPELVIAVNLSPVQFRRDDIERDVMNALSDSALAPHCLELELTESLLIADSKDLTDLLGRLRTQGIRLSIDDFGTGYSNLGYLKRFEVECLKIDQSFVRRMTENANDAGIVRAIIEMAHSLNLDVVAEGVEDAATLARLIELGCEYGQGFHWSPALAPGDFVRFVAGHKTAPTRLMSV